MEGTERPKAVEVGSVWVGGGGPLALIAGPCVIENRDHCLMMAERLRKVCDRFDMPLIFKSSYDKANRSSVHSYRGPGIDEGLRILEHVRNEIGLPVLSDIHSVSEVDKAASVLDAIQVPAFLSRQTDLIVAAGKSGKPVNVKKGQFMAPWDVRGVVDKLESAGSRDILLTERGTMFGYDNLVVDFRSFPILRRYGYPVVFDATHASPLPAMDADSYREHLVKALTHGAVAAGIDALFMEVHHSPADAPCDPDRMVGLDVLTTILPAAVEIDRAVKSHL